jgi:hypothetical protein
VCDRAWRWRATGASRERGSALWHEGGVMAGERAGAAVADWRARAPGRLAVAAWRWRAAGERAGLERRQDQDAGGAEAARRVEGGSGREWRLELGLPLGRATMGLYWAATADQGCNPGSPGWRSALADRGCTPGWRSVAASAALFFR